MPETNLNFTKDLYSTNALLLLAQMAYFKVPEIIMFVDELPMTESGKVQKKKMREITCQKLGIQSKL